MSSSGETTSANKSSERAMKQAYIRRLVNYCLASKGLLTAVFVCGAIGFSVTFAFPTLVGSLIDDVITARPVAGVVPSEAERFHRLWVLTGATVACAVLVAAAGWGRGHFTMKLGNRIVTRLRRDLFEHLAKLSMHFYSRQRSGAIVWRLMHEVHGVISLIHAGLILAILDVACLIITAILMIHISWKLGAAALAVMPLYFFTFRYFNPHIRRASEIVTQEFGRLSSQVQEQISAIALVKTYATEERELERFMKYNQAHYRHIVEQSRVGHSLGAISEMWIHLGTATIIGLGGYLVLTEKTLSAGDITRFIGYAGIFYGPLKRLAELDMVYQNSLASVRRVLRIFEIEPKIRERDNAVTTPIFRGAIRYHGVRFHYDQACDESRVRLDDDEPQDSRFKEPAAAASAGGDRWILDGIDIDIRAGERVALVGPSGAGKTTMASLLPRLYDADHGTILIDGVDVRDYSLKTLRESIAVVQQDSFIFSGTIRENILYGRPDATEQEMTAAAMAGNAHEFISRLPKGYDTLLGERGINLSGGQRQRVSIARALLKNPRILILDEATSSLDAESEALVQQALERLMEHRTCVIIAHRLSTVRSADRIFVLKRGRIVEEGRHEELLKRRGLYAHLVSQQLEGMQGAPPSRAT